MTRRTSRRTVLTTAFSGVVAGTVWGSPQRAAAATDPTMSPDGIVNVRAFGAVGDGTTDDTAAVLAAVAAAFDPASKARNHVFFPGGTYLVSQQITLDYGIVIEGAGAAASIIRMSPSVLSSMFVGGGGFPVSIEFRNIQLDGGYTWLNSKLQVPVGSGSVTTSARFNHGQFYDTLPLGAPTVTIAAGDVLRTSGQPVTFSTDGVTKTSHAVAGVLHIPMWAPTSPITGSTKWSVFTRGDLISNIGRLIVDNCALVGAKRHCIALPASGEVRITRSRLGVSQGCGVFSDGAGDGAIDNCWFIETGGANIYTYNATDFRFANCLIEGGGVANVYSEWGQVKIASSDLWGGRAGNIVSRQSGWIRGVDLQLRDPGIGGVAGALGSTSWARPSARPAIDCHFSGNAGAVLTAVALTSASDNLGEYRPQSIVRIRNGSRSSLSQIEFDERIGFVAHPIEDAGIATSTRGCRGHVVMPRSVRTLRGPDAVLVNEWGVPAVLVVRTTSHRIISVKMGSGPSAVELFSGGSSGAEVWQRQYTSPPVGSGGAITVWTDPAETAVRTTWFPA